jgi:hypothetical protein
MPDGYTYNVNPLPQAGLGAFGAVPGPIPLPNPYADLSNVFPNLSNTNAAVSSNILAGLGGNLSPSTNAAIQNYAAAFGAGQGALGSNAIPGTLAFDTGARNIGLSAEQQQQNAMRNYASIIPTIAQTQTVSPALQATIAGENTTNAAAPNPALQFSFAQQLLDDYLKQMRGPGGGTRAPGGRINMPGPITSASNFSSMTGGYYGEPGVVVGPSLADTTMYGGEAMYGPPTTGGSMFPWGPQANTPAGTTGWGGQSWSGGGFAGNTLPDALPFDLQNLPF